MAETLRAACQTLQDEVHQETSIAILHCLLAVSSATAVATQPAQNIHWIKLLSVFRTSAHCETKLMLLRAKIGPFTKAKPGHRGRCRASSQPAAPQQSWQELVQGKSFSCTQCGKCCTGAGEVWVTNEECTRLAAFLDVPLHRFLPAYTKSWSKKEGWRMLRSKGDDAVCLACHLQHPPRPCMVDAAGLPIPHAALMLRVAAPKCI